MAGWNGGGMVGWWSCRLVGWHIGRVLQNALKSLVFMCLWEMTPYHRSGRYLADGREILDSSRGAESKDIQQAYIGSNYYRDPSWSNSFYGCGSSS